MKNKRVLMLLALTTVLSVSMTACNFGGGSDEDSSVVQVTPTPEPVVVQTASGVNVTKQDGTYVANADVNLRADASTDATLIAGVANGTQLTSTGVCDNGWIEISYEGQTAYVSGDYVSAVAADTGADGAAAADTAADGTADGTADQAATDGSADAAADESVAG